MSDKEDIQDTISLASYAGTTRDWELLASTYLPDGAWDLAGSEYKMKGRDVIKASLPKFVEGTDYLCQTNSPAMITINGDKATAKSLIREAGKTTGKDEWLEFLGIYEDSLTRTPEGWRFSNRTFKMIGISRCPMLPDAGLPRES